MTKYETLTTKYQAVNENEARLLAAIQQNRTQASSLDAQYKQLEEQRHVYTGAKLVLEELMKEDTPTDCVTPCECEAPTPPQATVVPMPNQTNS